MSNYPLWWDQTITVYNKYEDPETNLISWYRHTITDCFWKYVGDSISIGSTVLETTGTVCRIRESKLFKPKYEWINLNTEDMVKYFTLGVDDIIILGKVEDEINEYANKQRSTDVVNKYKSLQGCILIKEIAIDVGPGRCNPHYRVKGE